MACKDPPATGNSSPWPTGRRPGERYACSQPYHPTSGPRNTARSSAWIVGGTDLAGQLGWASRKSGGMPSHLRTTALPEQKSVHRFHTADLVPEPEGCSCAALPSPEARSAPDYSGRWVSSWADPIRNQGERGKDPHQPRSTYESVFVVDLRRGGWGTLTRAQDARGDGGLPGAGCCPGSRHGGEWHVRVRWRTPWP